MKNYLKLHILICIWQLHLHLLAEQPSVNSQFVKLLLQCRQLFLDIFCLVEQNQVLATG